MSRCLGPSLLGLTLGCLILAQSARHTRSAYAQSSGGQAISANRAKYVGDAACLPCHRDQGLGYIQTSHHLSSMLAQKSTVSGSFASGSNILTISNPLDSSQDPRLYFTMDAKADGLYQTAVAELGTKRLTHSERFDIVIGSGVRGQTYLYWKGDELFELPLSYWTDGHRWINSPGYKDGTANFQRHVDSRCMECHASYIHALSNDPQTNVYDPGSFVPGIGCESCHGAGADHVTQETNRSGKSARLGRSILNPARFSRDRRIDQCALCHNGTAREELTPAFSYVSGEPLDNYLAPNPLDIADHPDVHGNQVGLLKRSRCYLASPEMSCSTCHEIHGPERTAASYSGRCLTCHTWQSCGASKVQGEKIKGNCIDCHMPLQETKAIVSVTAGDVVRASIRTHWIKVYPGGPHTP